MVSLILRSGGFSASRRMGCNLSWFETREDALLTMRTRLLQHRQASRSRSTRKGFVERGDFVFAKHKLASRGIVGGVLQVEAFGIANTEGSRVRKLRAIRRGDTPCALAIVCSTSPALL